LTRNQPILSGIFRLQSGLEIHPNSFKEKQLRPFVP
jgi:hypothetical protein